MEGGGIANRRTDHENLTFSPVFLVVLLDLPVAADFGLTAVDMEPPIVQGDEQVVSGGLGCERDASRHIMWTTPTSHFLVNRPWTDSPDTLHHPIPKAPFLHTISRPSSDI